MPIKESPKLPNSPTEVLQSKFSDVKYLLGRQFEQDQRALQSQYMTDQDYQVKNVELNAHYNKLLEQHSFEFKSRAGELERIKSSVGRGEMTDQAGYQAGWKMVLPHETYSARFPTLSKESGAQGKPMSASAIKSAGNLMGEYIADADEKRGIEWGKPKRTKVSLIEKYTDWRAQSGYDQLDTMHQRQLDLRWDAIMRSDKVYRDWFADEKKTKTVAEVVSLRSPGRLGKAMSKKFVPRQYGSGRPGSVTPIGQSFQKNIGAKGKKHLPDTDQAAPSAEELMSVGSEEAYNKGVKLGYWK